MAYPHTELRKAPDETVKAPETNAIPETVRAVLGEYFNAKLT